MPASCPSSARRAVFSTSGTNHLSARGPATDAGLAFIVGFDNIAIGIHGTSLIAFMSSLTSAKYTATQYAVLSSLYSLPGKLLMGTSGFMVDALGYGDFFLYTAALSIPGLLLLLWLSRREIISPRELDVTRALCSLAELETTGSHEFAVGEGDWPLRGFIVRDGRGHRRVREVTVRMPAIR